MENISVSVRVRPLNKQEENSGQSFAWKIDGNSISQLEPTRDRTKYVLDNVFGPGWTTEKIYEVTTQGLIQKMIKGFNSTVFAYGQTSSGKTHTMRGTPESPGITPLAVAEAFRLIEADEAREFLIRMSYMEIYNEDINDLLAPENEKLAIRESPESGPYVCGLREEIISSPEQVLQLLETGEVNRHVGSTKMNEKSSRSHTIFRMVVESRAIDAESDDAGAVLVSALTLVDLAGSERVAKTGAEGIRMKEGTAINKSLLTLGNVINKLSEGALAAGSHIPYRDSKLTRILQPSLGGNAKTAIICAMTPAACHSEESHITLRFACRAKSVVNNASVNEVLSDRAVLVRQAKEIEELRKRLAAGEGGACSGGEVLGLRAQLLRAEQEKDLLQVQLQEREQEKEQALQLAERAQKEAENTKKLFFKPQKDTTEGGLRKQNRRETWCPGKSAWEMPSEATSEANQTPTNSGTGPPSHRKRCHSRLDGAGQSKVTAGLSVLAEEDEDDEDGAEGPTPQRRRREHSVVSDYIPEEDNECQEADTDMGRSLERIMASLPPQDCALLSLYVQQHQASKERVEALEQELVDRERLAAEQVVSSRSACDALIEQAKWQARMQEKKAEEVHALCRKAEQERDALAASLAESAILMEAKCADLTARCKDLAEKHASTKEQTQALKAELVDARAKLEKRDYEYNKLETKEAETKAKLEELEAKLRQKVEEVDAVKATMQAAEGRTEEAEKRARVLYDEVKRLEVHVQELESRKRAPLYQKKQEEELKAAVEKAQECEVRAVDAELRAKEVRAALEALQKEMTELQESSSAAARQAADTQQELIERHALEMQRLAAENTLQKEHYDEEMATLRVRISEHETAVASLEDLARAKDQQLAGQQEDAAALRARIRELEDQEGELQACAIAAQEKIAHLEHLAEAEAVAHEAALAALDQQHKAALEELEHAHKNSLSLAAGTHSEALALVESKLAESKARVAQLEEDLRAARERVEQVVKASLEQSQAATAAQADLQRQVADLSAKVQEASGALKAKEELKEERHRNKQEVANLKSELQKLQLESKSGAKGKDLAQKEMEGLKKRLTDTETKLRAALQDKTAALQEKGNIERQLKQFQSQKLMIEKTLEKKDAIESKKRESIMVKSKEQLSSVEERLKGVQVELQRLQMDYSAKQCECTSLEEQLKEQQLQNASLATENDRLGLEGDDLRHQLECLSNQCKGTTEQCQAAQAEIQQVRETLVHKEEELAQLQVKLAEVAQNEQSCRAALDQMRAQHDALLHEKGLLQSSVEVARQALQDMEKHASQQQTDMREEIATHIEEKRGLDASLKAAQEALAAAKVELSGALAAQADAQGQWQSATAELEATTSQLKQKEAELAQLQEQLSCAHESETRCRAVLEEVRSQCDALQAAVRDAHTAKVTEEEGRQAAEGLAKEAIAEVSRLQALLAASDDEKQALRSQLAALHDSLAATRAELEAAMVANAAHQDKLRAESMSELTDLNAALSVAGQRSAALEAELGAVRAQLVQAQALDAELADLRAQLTCAHAMEAELGAVRAQLAGAQALDAELADLRAQLAEARAQAANANSCSDLTRSLVGGMTRLLPEDELQQRLNTLTALNQELEETVFSMNERQDAAQKEQQQLKHQLVAVERELAERSQQVAELQHRCAGLEDDLARAQQRADNVSPAPVANDSSTSGFAVEMGNLANERDELALRLAQALASQEELKSSLVQGEEQRDHLLRIIDDLSVQLTSKPSELQTAVDEREGAHLASQKEAESRIRALQERVVELEAELEERAASLQQLSLQFSELQQRCNDLEHDAMVTKRKLEDFRSCPQDGSLANMAAAASEAPDGLHDVAPRVDGDNDEPRGKIAELLQRQADLEAEMSDVQAACNVAVAEKNTLERAMTHRVLELETANIRLQDELARLRDNPTTSNATRPEPIEANTDALLGELEGLKSQVQQLTVSLENAVLAKEEVSKRMGAELESLRSAFAGAEASNAQLQESQRRLTMDLESAQQRAAILQDALTAATAAHATATGHASDEINEAKSALSSLLLSYDELVAQHAQLQRELVDKSADAEALRAGLSQTVQKHKEAESRGENLEAIVHDLRVELLAAQNALATITTTRDEAVNRLAQAEGSIGLRQELELQLSSLQATVTRLTNEASDAKRSIASLEAELQELLDANTLLESQVRELRASNAALQTQLSSQASVDQGDVAVLEAQLRESEGCRSRLEQQVTELAQQMRSTSAQHRAGALERAELESSLRAAEDARCGLEAQVATLMQTRKELQEENRALDEELQTVRADLAAAGNGQSTVERINELQSQLELQETRHRLATQKLQEDLALLRKCLDEKQREFLAVEDSLRQHAQELTETVQRLQDSQEEVELAAKQREAELNAGKLTLQSQIHWLTEENVRLQRTSTAAAPAPPPDLDGRIQTLEDELRRAKRAEIKLQGLLFRIRNDVEDFKKGALDFDKLLAKRSEQYDIDMLTEKCKRLQREIHARDQQLAAFGRGTGGKTPLAPPKESSGSVLVDKENLPYR